MKKYYLIFLLIGTYVKSVSQVYTPEWGKIWIGSNTNPQRGSSINQIENYIIDNNGGHVFLSQLTGLYDYDPGPATYTLLTSPDGPGAVSSNAGAVIYKLDSLGNFLWAKKIFNPAISVRPVCSATDSHSNIYFTLDGQPGTIDVDPGTAVVNMTISSNYQILIKLNKNGDYQWAKKIPTSTYSFFRINRSDVICAYDIANGTVDIDPSPATYTLSALTGYVAKYDTSGSFTSVVNLGPYGSYPTVIDMAFDQNNNPIMLGRYTSTTDFDSGPGTQTLSVMPSMMNFCVFKAAPTFDIIWENAFHVSNTFLNKISCNALGEVYVGGDVAGSNTIYPIYGNSTYSFTCSNGKPFFAIKYDVNGTYVKDMYVPNAFLFDVYFGQDGSFYTCGYLGSYVTDFDPGPGTHNLSGHALGDAYFSVYDPDFLLKNVHLYNNSGPENSQNVNFIRGENNGRVFCHIGQDVNTVNYGVSGNPFVITGTANALLKFYKTCGFAVIGGTTPICSGTSSTLTASGGTSYTWQPGGVISSSIVVSPTVSTTYSVSGTNACGIISNTFALAVAYNPTITLAAGSSSVCVGKNTVISGQVVGTPPMYIKWNGGSWTGYTSGTPFSYTVTPGVPTTYTMTTQDKCATLSETVTIQTVALPSLNVSGTTSVCAGTTTSLIVSGADTYSWSTGAIIPNIVISPNVTTIYTVTGTDLNNCSSTQTVSITVDNTCQDVWPGDANSDGIADNLDVLELGLRYTETGAPRASTSNNWQSYFANNWAGTITNGKNVNHSDCNGDGTINDNDTLAIFNNYGLTHAFKSNQQTVINPQISIVPDQAMVLRGNWGSASVYVGDAITSLSNVNGLAFTIDFDNTLIETNNIYLEYQNSFLDAGQNLHFRKLDFANGKLYTATTHTISNNVSGNGLIAKLHYQIKSSLTADQVLNLGIVQANQSNASGAIVPLTSGTGSLMAVAATVGIQELNGSIVSISPNPTNGLLTVTGKSELQKIEVVSIAGQVLANEMPTGNIHTLHLDNFANGIYFVNVYQNGRIIKREKVVVNR